MSKFTKGFVDRLRVFVQAGSGAPGNPSVKGKGGDGGSIYLEVNEKQTLEKITQKYPTKRFKAGHGLEASKTRGQVIGHNGSDLIIPVPPGVSVLSGGQGNSGMKASQRKIGDLDTAGQKLLVAQGGFGGCSKTGYQGTRGQAHSIVLDLKLLADIGMIGFPNAGKSSLLCALSGAKAKIASYPFTTLRPQVAICKYSDHRSISLADLPGLADIYARYADDSGDGDVVQFSSSKLPALRHAEFLKHVERNSCLLLVIDSLGFQRDQLSPWRSPLASAYLLNQQVERYCQGILMNKPVLCVLNKIDLPGAVEAAEEAKYWIQRMNSEEARDASGLPASLFPRQILHVEDIFMVSANAGTNIPELKTSIRDWLDEFAWRKRKAELEENRKSQCQEVDACLTESLPLVA